MVNLFTYSLMNAFWVVASNTLNTQKKLNCTCSQIVNINLIPPSLSSPKSIHHGYVLLDLICGYNFTSQLENTKNTNILLAQTQLQ
jgi:hypothetical protein